MANIEMQIITKRQIPKGVIETFNRQTSKDFSMRILTRYPQKWEAKDLKIDFPLKILPQKLFYSTGTRFALCLARNELLTYTESKYVLALDDFFIIPPFAVEALLSHLEENLIIQSIQNRSGIKWGSRTYNRLFGDMSPEGTIQPMPSRDALTKRVHLWTGCMLFPMKALRKVNGWNLAFDGAWGSDDGDLATRMRKAGVKYACLSSFKSYQLKHESPKKEKDDPQIGEGFFIINKETGRKMNISGKQICLRGIRDETKRRAAWKSRNLSRLPDGHAKFGLNEVRVLL